VVVDSLLRIPPDAAVLSDAAALTIVATTERAPRERMRAVADRGADVLVLPQDADGRVDLTAALAALVERGVDSLLIEGGRGLITATLRGRLAERILVCIAPKIVGTGIDAIGDLHIRHMDKAVTFRDTSFRQVGDDIIFEGVLADPVTGAITG
jgi:5-amino-6-(5-phosphoribosylamino)uracil reductase/diaminohydroxyphosphoribosylaminopyrimidine deaminase/5-amino-6-(5-phosphoribosylamino)uracil reductase